MDASVRPLIRHASTAEEFALAVQAAAVDGDDPLSAERRAFARSRSWDSVVARMLEVVDAELASSECEVGAT